MKDAIYSLKKFLTTPLGNIVLTIALYVPIMGLFLAFLTVFDAPIIAVIMAVVFSCFGWQALSKITPDIFLIMPIGGWITYYIVKAFISFFLGVFVAPVVIGKKISKLISKQIATSMYSSHSTSNSKAIKKTVPENSNTNVSVNISEFEKMMASLSNMGERELEEIHKDLLYYMSDEPVPVDGRDYLKDLVNYRNTPVRQGTVYGCTTYGEIEKLNAAIVNIMNSRNKK